MVTTTSATRKLVMVAAGGTGGHIFPALAFMEVMRKQRRYRLALISDRRALPLSGSLANLSIHRIFAAGVSGRRGVRFVSAVLLLFLGLVQSFRILRKTRPAVVIGFGGYAALPPILAANLTRVPTVLHEQNAVLGRANRLLLPGADRVALSFRETRHVEDAVKKGLAVWTGNPVRMAFRNLPSRRYNTQGLNIKGLDTDVAGSREFRLLVLGGSQGARLFGEIVPDALLAVPDTMRARLRVCHQVRGEQLSAVRRFYKQHSIVCEARQFFSDMAQRMRWAHLVICRAGAATLAELATVGRPAILIPFAHAIDDHQRENALHFVRAGAGWMMPEESLSTTLLSQKIQSLMQHGDFLRMAAGCARRFSEGRAQGYARPQGYAEERLVALVRELLEGDPSAPNPKEQPKTNSKKTGDKNRKKTDNKKVGDKKVGNKVSRASSKSLRRVA